MSFNFKWPTFSADFHADAARMLDGALNRGKKPKVIADDIRVRELGMGTIPPELEILEIGDLSTDRFRGIFRLTYAGDAHLVLSTKVQANPLAPSSKPDTSLGLFPESDRGILFAAAPLIVPMQLRLSAVRLRAIVVLVVSRQKGITLVFKNDPLESVDVSSTFDSVAVIQKYLQSEIEGQLREMFREDLPGIIHRLSQKWLSGESKRVSGETGNESAAELPVTGQTGSSIKSAWAQQDEAMTSLQESDVREAPVPRSTSDPRALAKNTSSPARKSSTLPVSEKKRSGSRSRVSTQDASTSFLAGGSPPRSSKASTRKGAKGHNAKSASTSAAPLGGELTRDGSEPAWRFAFGTDNTHFSARRVDTGSVYGLEEESEQNAYDPTYGLRPDALRAPSGSTYSGLARLANVGKGGLRDLAGGSIATNSHADAADGSNTNAREGKARRSTGVGLEWTGNSYSPDASSVLARAAHDEAEDDAGDEGAQGAEEEEEQEEVEESFSPASNSRTLDDVDLEEMDESLEAEDEMALHGPDSESEESVELDPIEKARGVDPERFGYPRPRSESAFESSSVPGRPASLFARALGASSPSGTLRGSARTASALEAKRSTPVGSYTKSSGAASDMGLAKANGVSDVPPKHRSVTPQRPRVFHSASQIQPLELSDEDPYEDAEDRAARLAAQAAQSARSAKTFSAAPSSTVRGGALRGHGGGTGTGTGTGTGSVRTLRGAPSSSAASSPMAAPMQDREWYGSTRSRLRNPLNTAWAGNEANAEDVLSDDSQREPLDGPEEAQDMPAWDDGAHIPRSASNNSLSGGEGSLATLEPEPMDPRSHAYRSHLYKHRAGGVYRPGYGSETASVSGSFSGTSDSRSRSSALNRPSSVSPSAWGNGTSLSTAPTSTHPTGAVTNEKLGDASQASPLRGMSASTAASGGGRQIPAGAAPGHKMTIDASRHLAELVTSNHTLSPYTRTLDTRGFTVRSAPVTPGGSGSSTPVTGTAPGVHGASSLSMQQLQSQRLAKMNSYAGSETHSDSHDAPQRPGPPRRRRTFKLGGGNGSTSKQPSDVSGAPGAVEIRRGSYPVADARSASSAPQTAAAQHRPAWQRSRSGDLQREDDASRPGFGRHGSFRPPSEAARAAASRWSAIRE